MCANPVTGGNSELQHIVGDIQHQQAVAGAFGTPTVRGARPHGLGCLGKLVAHRRRVGRVAVELPVQVI